jgi:hypothetical protein
MEGTTFEPSVHGGTINVSKNGQDAGCLPRYRTFEFASLRRRVLRVDDWRRDCRGAAPTRGASSSSRTLEHASCRLDLGPDAPPRDEGAREYRIREVDR